MREVTIKSRGDDDTESMFKGTAEEARAYMSGYLDALIVHTSYTFYERNIEEGYAVLHSQLISEADLILEIVQSQDNVVNPPDFGDK